MFARQLFSSANPVELARVEHDVRNRYEIDAADIVLVSEEPTNLAGGPARMTTILFWIGPENRHRIRVFKPVHDISNADLPPAWLKSALIDDLLEDCC